jgi:hypothetical protein
MDMNLYNDISTPKSEIHQIQKIRIRTPLEPQVYGKPYNIVPRSIRTTIQDSRLYKSISMPCSQPLPKLLSKDNSAAKMADVAAAGAEVALAATAMAAEAAETAAVAVAETAAAAAIAMAMAEGKTRGRGDLRAGVCGTSWGSTYTTWQLFGAK